MRAASLNFRDLAIIAGKYFRGPLTEDTIPLSDGAGEVAAVGAGVTQFAAGDRVVATFTQGNPPAALGYPLDGTLAEYAVFPADGLLRLPPHLSFEEAATLPCAGVTVWNALMHGPRSLKPGETVLALGTGGVSIFALQIAKMAGARAIITSSSDAKLEKARALGADVAVSHADADVVQAVKDATGGKGADVVVETVGEATWERSLAAAAQEGRVVVCGATSGHSPPARLYRLWWKQLAVFGSTMGMPSDFEGAYELIRTGRARIHVDSVFPLAAAATAHERLESGAQFGKVVLSIP
jgi:NADPH:quinone reductase-like Zn-dependent oxidoreductase